MFMILHVFPKRFPHSDKPAEEFTHIIVEEVVEDVTILALPEQVLRDGAEGTGMVEAESTGCDEQRDGHRNGQIDGEGEAEALDADLACEFTCESKVMMSRVV